MSKTFPEAIDELRAALREFLAVVSRETGLDRLLRWMARRMER